MCGDGKQSIRKIIPDEKKPERITIIFTCPMCGDTEDISTLPGDARGGSIICNSCGWRAPIFGNYSVIIPGVDRLSKPMEFLNNFVK